MLDVFDLQIYVGLFNSRSGWRHKVADTDETKQSRKRRLRAPSESVRERAEKAREIASAPKQRGAIGSFLYGLTWPLRILGRGVVWLSHRPPLKQIGHGFSWFATLRPVRFVGRILGFGYVAGSFNEVKRVTWPTWRQSFRLTGAVIIFSIVFGGLIAGVDYGLDKVFKQIILK
jgi:preprotein translocase SecE subunit